MTYLDGAGQFLGSAISRPRNSLANEPISAIFAYRAADSRLLRPPHDTYVTFGVLKRTAFSSPSTVLISRLNKWSLRSCVIVKSKHTMKTCSLRQFQRYPTTYMCWAMTKPLLWIKLILSHSKGWVGLNTYRLWGIIGIVLMSTFLIHAYFLRSRHFAKPRLFSREISTVLSYYSCPFSFSLFRTPLSP